MKLGYGISIQAFAKKTYFAEDNDKINCISQWGIALLLGREQGVTVWEYKINNEGFRLKQSLPCKAITLHQKKGFWSCGVEIAKQNSLTTEWLGVSEQGVHEHHVVALCYIDNPVTLISGDSKGVIKIWDLDRNENTQTLSSHTDAISSLFAYAPGVLASSSKDGTIKFWDMKTWTCERTLKPHYGKNIGTICLLKNGIFVSHGVDNQIKFCSN